MIFKYKIPEILLNIIIPFLSIIFIIKFLYIDFLYITENKFIHIFVLFALIQAGYFIVKNILLAFLTITIEDKSIIIRNALTKENKSINFENIILLKVKKAGFSKPFDSVDIVYFDPKEKTITIKLPPSTLYQMYILLSSKIDNIHIDKKSLDYVNKMSKYVGIDKIIRIYSSHIFLLLFILLCVFIYITFIV